MTKIFEVWVFNEPDSMTDTEYKFSTSSHPISTAMWTNGKTDHLAKQTIGELADWALRKLFVACVKVLWWIAETAIKRAFERRGTQ